MLLSHLSGKGISTIRKMGLVMLLGCLWWSPQPVLAHSGNNNLGIPFIQNYDRETYGAGTQNWSIIQDSRQLIYVANNNGLLEYDGSNWTCYPLANRTICRSVALDERGRIFAGGQGEIGFFEPDASGRLTYHSLLDKIAAPFRQFTDVWQVLVRGQMVHFRASDRLYTLQDDTITVADDQAIRFIGLAGDRLYAQNTAGELLWWDNDAWQVVAQNTAVSERLITAVLPYRGDTVVFATLKGGLYRFDGSSTQEWTTSFSNYLKENRTYCAIALGDNRYAFGTSRGGLLIAEKSGRLIHRLTKRNDLQNNNILSLHADRDGNLWLGLDNGIDFVEVSSPFNRLYPDGELTGTAYTALVHDRKIYFGTNNGLYYADWKDYYDPFDGQRFEALSNTAGQVWGLNEVGTQLLLGHHEGAFQVREGQAEMLSGRTGSWTFLQPETTPGWLVEGTYTGLNVYRAGPDQRWVFWAKPEGLEESCRLMTQDGQGYLWIAHPYRGVYRVKLQADGKAFESVRLYTAEDGFPSDLNTHVFNINGELVFTGETGVFTYNRQADRFEPHEQFSKLFGMDIRLRQLVRDGQGNLWYATEEEVGLVTVTDKGLHKELSRQTFPQLRKSLVGGFEFIYPYDEHNVFFGTTKGFIHFNPALLRPVEVNPIIRQVSLVGNPDSIIFGGNHFTSKGMVANQPAEAIPELTHRENNLRFTVSATDFEQWQDLSFAYFLDGFDDAWSASMAQQEKEYTNLGPGEYTFQVRIIGPDGQVGAQREYRFRIAPAWYRSNWAYALYVMVLLGVILGLILVPRRQYEKEKAQLRSEQEETLKQKELQHEKALEQSERAIMKLRNEKLRSEVSHKNSELASATMHLVQKGEMLHTIRNELIKAQESTVAPKVQQVLRQIIRMINADGQLDRDWDQFERYFDQVHVNFLQRLRENFPELTPKDIKLCAYLRINLSTKEIAPLMNISVRGVEISRYRLRKKLGLDKEDNLVEFITQV